VNISNGSVYILSVRTWELPFSPTPHKLSLAFDLGGADGTESVTSP
jgi:hypothetical protein